MKTQTHILSVAAVLAASLLASCGKSDDKSAAAAAILAPAEGRLIEIKGDDTMKYSVTEIVAQPGEKLVVQLKNAGVIPKPAMAHNWVLLKPMDEAALVALCTAAASRPPEHLPADMSSVLAHTKMAGAGETTQTAFAAPTAPGTYPFVCTFPGHFMVMRGKLIVK